MISLKSFVKAIHDAILVANEDLMERNVGLLDKYFVDADADADLQNKLNEALKVSKNIVDKRGAVTRDDFKTATDALEEAKDALQADDSSSEAKDIRSYTPRTVVLEYPKNTASGVEYVPVHVPLLTLTPLNMSQVEKAVLKADFELEMDDEGNLQLNFVDSSNRWGRRDKTRGSLEITIAPHEMSQGLKSVIEGYERALKSQLPQ
jgi:hypothetical protein